MKTRTLAIGDIHGMHDALLRTLELADVSPSDQLVFLGDYINRGKQSREVMDRLCAFSENPKNVFLRGNHEEMILKLFTGRTDYWYMWLEYGGGRACLESYGIDANLIRPDGTGYVYASGGRDIPLSKPQESTQFIADLFPENHLALMLKTVTSYETPRYFFSHAGIETGGRLKGQNVYADCFLKWGDEEFLMDETRYEKIVIFGHYHLEKPLIRPNKACIALQNAVALLDLSNRKIFISNGTILHIDNDVWL